MSTKHASFTVLILSLISTLVAAQASTQPEQVSPPTIYSTILDTADSAAMSSQSSAAHSANSFWDNLSRHWLEADSTKQTFMAVFLIVQLIGLSFAIKGSLDKLFGRRAEYRNQRTKRFARRAAVAAAGGYSKAGIPLSHQRPLYRPDNKPQLPPRPSQNHPTMSSLPSPSLSQAAFQTSPSGDIILPSWTESGPTPLNIIVEDPEGEISRSNSPLYSRPQSPAFYRDIAHSTNSPVHQDASHDSWSYRSTSPRDSTSLRLRERNDYGMLPFNIDRSSTPDTRLEDVKRPFNRPNYVDDRSARFSPPTSYTQLPSPPATMQTSSPA